MVVRVQSTGVRKGSDCAGGCPSAEVGAREWVAGARMVGAGSEDSDPLVGAGSEDSDPLGSKLQEEQPQLQQQQQRKRPLETSANEVRPQTAVGAPASGAEGDSPKRPKVRCDASVQRARPSATHMGRNVSTAGQKPSQG